VEIMVEGWQGWPIQSDSGGITAGGGRYPPQTLCDRTRTVRAGQSLARHSLPIFSYFCFHCRPGG